MAAKVYSAPKEIKKPEFLVNGEYDHAAYGKACDEYVAAVRKFCEEKGSGDLRGKEIRFGVADGHASYLVFSSKPLQLIHLEMGDAWHFQYAHLLTLAEVRKEVRALEGLNELFGSKG
jgi:hypothetical protein